MASKGSTSTDRVWEIIETVGIAMLTTSFPGGLRARPVEARPERDAGLIWFVTDLRSGKEHEIEAEHDVGLVFIDAKAKAYLSITARAEVRRDHAKAAEIWKRTDNMWWKRPGRSERLRIARAPSHRRTVGRPGERRRGRVRIRQGTHHRQEAEPRREPQGNGENDKGCCPAQIRRSARANGRARPIGSSGTRSAPASGSLSATAIARARFARTSWAIKRPERRRCSFSRSAARAHSRCRPQATGAASSSIVSATFNFATEIGGAERGMARRKAACSSSTSTSTSPRP